jgi:hypothetical protein
MALLLFEKKRFIALYRTLPQNKQIQIGTFLLELVDGALYPPTSMPRILFVSGFHPSTRARDLAFEFER